MTNVDTSSTAVLAVSGILGACAVVTLIVLACGGCRSPGADQAEQSARPSVAQAPTPDAAPSPPAPFTFVVPGTTAALEMRPVLLDTRPDPDAHETRPDSDAHGRGTLFVAATETTWDMYDAFVFALDRGEGETDPPDAWARPSKPYILMDRGFGHRGYPAISVSHRGAVEFCKWLSVRTGRTFRLPTEAEWKAIARASATDDSNRAARAWCAENAEVGMRLSTHAVATKEPDALGLHDLFGNAAEWTAGPDGRGVARGGSFRDPGAALSKVARHSDERALNASDPQIPKSAWWLADGGFIGFRVVAEPER